MAGFFGLLLTGIIEGIEKRSLRLILGNENNVFLLFVLLPNNKSKKNVKLVQFFSGLVQS